MNKFFKLQENGTKVSTEIIAGVTTFFTMAYIIFVNPTILSLTGMSWGGVFVATILATIVGTLVMGLVANVPYALAPGMGLNAVFTFTVCFNMGFAWQEALAIVFICGIINIVITVTKVRKSIIKSIPKSLQNAIGGSIGLFIAYIGVKSAGFLTFTADPGTTVTLQDGTVIANSSIVPALNDFSTFGPILALIGLAVTIFLVARKFKGAILIGIAVTTIIGIVSGYVDTSAIKSAGDVFDISSASAIKDTFGQAFSSAGFGALLADSSRYLLAIIAIFAFSLSDTFDTIGTFIGTGRVSGIFDEKDEEALYKSSGFKSKMDKALFADATATSIGAVLGTSNTTTYVESSAGIAAGGRTGLTSVVVAVLFLLCIPFQKVFGLVPAEATAPALIVVGILMMTSFKEIDWADFETAAPCFMTAIFMVFTYNISYGIAAGFIFYCLIKLSTMKIKEIHPILAGASFLFLINFVVMALRAAKLI